MDFDAAGLLDGLNGAERQAREELLERLADEGFTLAELRAAVAEDRLALLPVERVLSGRYTAEEIAERTGLPAELLIRIRRLLGLPEAQPHERVFNDEEVAAAESIKLFVDAGMGDDAIAEITRVLGESMSRVAATTVAAFADTFMREGDSEQAVAWRFAGLAEQLVPAFSPVLLAAYQAHLREAVERGMISREELAAGQLVGEQEMAVCFADLVGFTALGGEVETEELGSVISRFTEIAADVADPQVRLVKTIGDAAMFSAREPGPLVRAALSLLDAVKDADLPSLRAGVAYGRALPRAGDLYGHAVNVASRVTGIARPGSVLCTPEVREAAPDEFDWSFAGRHRLKGLDESIPLYRARALRASQAGQSSDGSAAGARRSKAGRRRKRASS
jgi:adenylate cyclase